MDYAECSQWVNLSGGYLNLQEMVVTYLETVAWMVLIWLSWVVYNRLTRRRRKMPQAYQHVSLGELSEAFNVSQQALEKCQESQFAVVHFDQSGHIIGLEKGS